MSSSTTISPSSSTTSTSSLNDSIGTSDSLDGSITLIIVVVLVFCFGWTPKMLHHRYDTDRYMMSDIDDDLVARAMNHDIELGELSASRDEYGLGNGLGSSRSFDYHSQLRRQQYYLQQRNYYFSRSMSNSSIRRGGSSRRRSNHRRLQHQINRNNRMRRRELGRRQQRRELLLRHLILSKFCVECESEETKEEDTAEMNSECNITQRETSQIGNEDNDNYYQMSKTLPMGSSCAICLGEYKPGDEICHSYNENCTHLFHKDCMLSWLLCDKDECPCCREKYVFLPPQANDEEEDSSSSEASYLRHVHHQRYLISSSSSEDEISEEDTSIQDDININFTPSVLALSAPAIAARLAVNNAERNSNDFQVDALRQAIEEEMVFQYQYYNSRGTSRRSSNTLRQSNRRRRSTSLVRNQSNQDNNPSTEIVIPLANDSSTIVRVEIQHESDLSSLNQQELSQEEEQAQDLFYASLQE